MSRSKELAQERLSGHHNWPVNAKTVNLLVGKIHHHLEGMGCLGLLLEIDERGRESDITHLDFHKKLRLAISHYQKVHFALLLISEIAQFKVSKSKISPALHGFQQMTGDKSLCSRPIV